ncbi:hypothetical protein HK405_014767 [Cladochytrium tenue]|nr:hypothetical protein HK405_014767 [Cladochytrium tenue]
MSTSDTSSLYQATQAQAEQCLRLSFPQWGPPLDEAGYINREITLAKVGRSFAPRQWVLVPSDDKETLDILSSCETLLRQGVLVLPDGSRREGRVASIASVFTAEKHRRRGYAARMLTQLARAAETEYPDLLGMALYSDIGPVYYARLGWQPMDTWTTTVRVPDHLATEAPASEGLAVVELSEADVPGLLEADGEARVKRAVNDARADGCPRLVELQNADSNVWHRTRGLLYSTKNAGDEPPAVASVVGAQVVLAPSGHTEAGEVGPVFALWSYNYKEGSVDILRLAANRSVDVAALFRAAATAAVRAGLPVVRAWGRLDFAEAAIRQQLGGESSVSVFEVAMRTSSIPSLRLSSAAAEAAGPEASAVNWLAEKGQWC